MDKRKNNGGKRKGAGRKSKADELKLAEQMDNVLGNEEVIKKLSELVKDKNMKAIDLWMAYRYGRPQQKIDHTTDGESIVPPIKWE